MFIKIAELWTRISEILKVGTMKMRKCLTKFSWLFLNSQHSPMCFYHRLYHREILSFLNVYPVHEYTPVLLRVVLRFKMRPAVRPKKASRSLSLSLSLEKISDGLTNSQTAQDQAVRASHRPLHRAGRPDQRGDGGEDDARQGRGPRRSGPAQPDWRTSHFCSSLWIASATSG